MTLQQKIEALTFYGTNDEAYELFQATCGLCYQMSGLGYQDKAVTLYYWAKELAQDSLEWTLDNFDSVDEVDKIQGSYSRN